MQKINKIIRKDYTGEEITSTGLYINSEWVYQKEFINSPLDNYKPLDIAIVVGNGISRLQFDLSLFMAWRETTPWGARSQWHIPKNNKKFDTYGCNALYRNYQPKFLITTGQSIVDEVANDEYSNNNVVYASKFDLIKYPGKFTFIPQDPQWNSGALAAYLAAFDGHKKIFLLGFDGIDSKNIANVYAGTEGYPAETDNINEEFWVRSLTEVMSTYSDTEFIRVAPTGSYRSPEAWKYCVNYRVVDFRQFVLEADL